MKFIDLIRLVINNLNRRKARVGLTAIGVVIGTGAVVILVSLAIGLQMNANEQLYGIGNLSQINVMPNYGGGEGGGGGSGPKVMVPNSSEFGTEAMMLTNTAIKDLQALPGVTAVIPREYLNANMVVGFKKMQGYSNIFGVGTTDLTDLGLKADQ